MFVPAEELAREVLSLQTKCKKLYADAGLLLTESQVATVLKPKVLQLMEKSAKRRRTLLRSKNSTTSWRVIFCI